MASSVPLPIIIGKSQTHELLQKALLLLKRMEKKTQTEEHTYGKGVYSPSEVKRLIKRIEKDENLRGFFPMVEFGDKSHIRDVMAQRGLMHNNQLGGKVHDEYHEEINRKPNKHVFNPHDESIDTDKEMFSYIKHLATMVAHQYDLKPDEENSSFGFTFGDRRGQDFDSVQLDREGNPRRGVAYGNIEASRIKKYDAIVEPDIENNSFTIRTVVNNAKHNPYGGPKTPLPPHNYIDLTAQEPTLLSRDPIGEGDDHLDDEQFWEEGGFRNESDFYLSHPIENPLPAEPAENPDIRDVGIVRGLDDRKAIISALKGIEMPHPQTQKNMFVPKQVRGDNTAIRLDWNGGKHKDGWNNHIDTMHGHISNAIASLPEEHQHSVGEAMFDVFHQSFDGMTPAAFHLNKEGMENVPGYAASVQKKDNEEDWMLKALDVIERTLLLRKAPVMPGRAGFPEDDPDIHEVLGIESGIPLLSANELYELAALGYGEGADPEVVQHYLGEKRPLTDEEHDAVIGRAIDQTVGEGEASHQEGSHSHEENAAQFEREGGRLVDFGYGFSGFGLEDGEGNELDVKTRPMVAPVPANRAVPHFPNTPINPQILGNVPWPDGFTTDNKSEPMKIALQLLKERRSPEAWANKKRYDSEYQKNPKRVKYREQLNAERRKRGIYGKGGKDVSHTQGGKLTLENPSSNRARHFKNRGTLRRVKVR